MWNGTWAIFLDVVPLTREWSIVLCSTLRSPTHIKHSCNAAGAAAQSVDLLHYLSHCHPTYKCVIIHEWKKKWWLSEWQQMWILPVPTLNLKRHTVCHCQHILTGVVSYTCTCPWNTAWLTTKQWVNLLSTLDSFTRHRGKSAAYKGDKRANMIGHSSLHTLTNKSIVW